jgi:NADH dehydrogenase FAD-containing subunit
MAPSIVILGGGAAGIFTAHKLLKYTTPKVKGLKVILISSSTHFYWTPASVRAIIPGEIPDESIFAPISSGFSRFPKDQFEFVVGTAISVDTASNTVQLQLNDGSSKSLGYDHLVIATGSSASESQVPVKTLGSYKETVNQLHNIQTQIDSAATKSIVVAGSGPAGVEVAAELGYRYGKNKEKTITLVADGPRVLDMLSESVARVAESTLTKLGVHIIRNARVSESRDKHVYLSTGKVLPADVYLPLFGVRANTSFLPEHLLDENKYLILESSLRVKGLHNIWGVGDVGNADVKQLGPLEAQVIVLAQNLDAALSGNSTAAWKEYTPSTKVMMAVSLGKAAGTGQMGGWKLPGFLIAMMKSKTLAVPDKPRAIVEGKSMIMGSI